MAQRRMFNKDQIFSDLFTSMKPTTQLAFFKLCLCADDDGFVSGAKQAGVTESSLKELKNAGYIFRFSTKIILIRHWLVHNRIRKDTYNPTHHQAEKALVILGPDNIYYLDSVTETSENGTVTVPQLSRDQLSLTQSSSTQSSLPQSNTDQSSITQSSLYQERAEKVADNDAVTAPACGAPPDKINNFNIFWDMYPKKKDKVGTYAVFRKIDAPFEEIMAGLENHMNSSQWNDDDGMYIPDPANWLYRQEWQVKKSAHKPKAPVGAAGELGPEELEMIRRALAEG